MGGGVHCKALNLNYKMMGLKEICDKMGKGYFNSGKLKISLSHGDDGWHHLEFREA